MVVPPPDWTGIIALHLGTKQYINLNVGKITIN